MSMDASHCRKDSTTGLDYRDWEKTAAKNNQTFEIMLDPIYCYDKETVSLTLPFHSVLSLCLTGESVIEESALRRMITF